MPHPEALDWSSDGCTIERASEILGDRWSLVILREVISGIRRFDQMTVRTAIPRQVLTDRLDRLVAQGILRREPYREPGQRQRLEYRLTDKGIDLYPVFVALQQWGDRYLGDEIGPPTEFEHRECKERVDLVLRCGAGHEICSNREVTGRLGPGARPRTPPTTP
jgi:DNA-binding HxlR family transcriptional regulator